MAKRLTPLFRARPDLRFDRPWARLARVAQFWLAQWRHPRYPAAGLIHILIFAGFLIAIMVWLLPFAETARVGVIVIVTYVVGIA